MNMTINTTFVGLTPFLGDELSLFPCSGIKKMCGVDILQSICNIYKIRPCVENEMECINTRYYCLAAI